MHSIKHIATLPGHEHPIYALANSSKTHIFFSGGGEAAVVEWSLKKMAHIKVMFKTSGSVYALLSSKSLPYLYAADKNGQLSIFDFELQKLIFQQRVASTAIFGMVEHAGLLYYVSQDGHLRAIDLQGKKLTLELALSQEALRSISIDAANANLYCAGKDKNIYRYQIENSKIQMLESGHSLPIFSLAYDHETKQLFSGSRDAQLKVWTDGAAKNIAAHMYAINDIHVDQHGEFLLTASMDKSIKLWSKKKLELLAVADQVKNQGHHKSVNRLCRAGFEDYLISCSDDRQIMIWQTNEPA